MINLTQIIHLMTGAGGRYVAHGNIHLNPLMSNLLKLPRTVTPQRIRRALEALELELQHHFLRYVVYLIW